MTQTDQRPGILAALARLDVAGAEVRDAFARQGITCVVLKGRAFAQRLYDHVWERPYSDTDMLVRLEDRRRAENVLAEHGYTRIDRDADRLGAAGYAHTFARGDGALIDLHWNVSGVTAPPSATWQALTDHTVLATVGGSRARVPDDAATALLVVLHNAHHGGRWTGNLPDLHRAISRIAADAWMTARELARRLGAVEAFAAGLAVSPDGVALARSLGIEPEVSLEYRLRSQETSYATWALHRLRTFEGPPVQRLRVLAEVLFPPPSAMRQFFPLARRGTLGLALAYGLRPLRLALSAGPAVAGYLKMSRDRQH